MSARIRALGFAVVGLLATTTLAHAQGAGAIETTWRCLDSSGKIHFTNIKDETSGKDCKVVHSQRVTVMPAQPAPKPAARPAGFPKESAGDRSSARDRQRATLETELKSEEALLAKARAELAEQESIRLGDEKNYAKVLERLQKYKDNVELHAKNADELRKELGKLR
jgi:hypothetical protein